MNPTGGHWLDKAIGYVSPSWGAQRALSRRFMATHNDTAGSGAGRYRNSRPNRLDGWWNLNRNDQLDLTGRTLESLRGRSSLFKMT